MLSQESRDCWSTRVSYINGGDIVRIEHFDEKGNLLCNLFMSYEEVYSYARSLVEIADLVLGVDDVSCCSG
jgi:hypothetical protein